LLLWGILLAYSASPAWAATTFEVTSTGDQADADTTDDVCDTDPTAAGKQCTLRAAIEQANATAGDYLIDIGLTGTVDLTGPLPDLSSNMEIEGPGADRLTVRRDTGGDYRIFRVTSGSVVSISGITITNGNFPAGTGGGILNSGTLTITGSTISGNSADFRGGGVFSNTNLSGTQETTISNSTISGNTATVRGGVYNNDGLTVIEHSTITNNTAPSGQGSGVASEGDTATRTEVLSTIISANTNTDVDFVLATNTFDSKGYNLIGDGNATVPANNAFDQTGDQSGVSDPKLGALSDNGGPTNTHALLAGSPAINAIPSGTNDCGTTFTEDQRGVTRPQGSACDIGSFELDTTPPSVTINQAAGQDDSTNSSPINFEVVFSEPVTGFTGADVTLSGTAGATTATVSGSGTTYTVAASGMSSDGTVIASIPANAAQDAGGNANSASTSTDNTVTFIANSPPTAVADSYTLNEDNTLNVAAPGVLGNDTDSDGDTLTAELVNDVDNGTLTFNQNGSFTYEPDENFNGSDSFTYKANDGTADSNVATVSITVNSVNDAPTITVVAGSASQSACLSDTRGRVTLKLSDVDSNVSSLTLSRSSSNTRLVPNSNVSFSGSGDTRTATITTRSGRTGSSTVTITASDSQASSSVAVTVNAGGNGRDTLTGTDAADLLPGQNGDDTLSALGGSDVLCGANGNDRLTGGSEADSFDGDSQPLTSAPRRGIPGRTSRSRPGKADPIPSSKAATVEYAGPLRRPRFAGTGCTRSKVYWPHELVSEVRMTQMKVRTEQPPMVLRTRPALEMDDEQLFEFCQLNREWRIERNAAGELEVMMPTGGETSNRNFKLVVQLGVWTDHDGTGVAFESNGGFILPNGAMRSPDASWVKRERLGNLSAEQKQRFLPLCPDFVIELRSPSDPLAPIEEKMREYIENGTQLGWLIDAEERKVHVYRPDETVRVLESPENVSGDPMLPGFVLDLRPIWAPGF
jgi:VCBS repeat-containing protein